MSEVIYKYRVPSPMMADFSYVHIPQDAKILSVNYQGDGIFLWAQVHKEAVPQARKIFVVPTGGTVPVNVGEFIGTVHFDSLVFHFFDS